MRNLILLLPFSTSMVHAGKSVTIAQVQGVNHSSPLVAHYAVIKGIAHVNSEFPDPASDHDPVLSRFQLL